MTPDLSPIILTKKARSEILAHAESTPDREVCGLLFGADGVGTRYLAMRNVHPAFRSNFRMKDDEVVHARRWAHGIGLKLVAVVHSHPTVQAIPSVNDREARDVETPLLIVSLSGASPVLRGWTLTIDFIGMTPSAHELKVDVVDEFSVASITPPDTPWALTPGNRIKVSYSRPNSSHPRTIGTVIASAVLLDQNEGRRSHEKMNTGRPRLNLYFNPLRGTDPRSMLVERIREVRVLEESPQAGKIRDRAVLLAGGLSGHIERDEFDEAAKCLAYLNAAFPAWLKAR